MSRECYISVCLPHIFLFAVLWLACMACVSAYVPFNCVTLGSADCTQGRTPCKQNLCEGGSYDLGSEGSLLPSAWGGAVHGVVAPPDRCSWEQGKALRGTHSAATWRGCSKLPSHGSVSSGKLRAPCNTSALLSVLSYGCSVQACVSS